VLADGRELPWSPEVCEALLRIALRGMVEESRGAGGLRPAPGLAAALSALADAGTSGTRHGYGTLPVAEAGRIGCRLAAAMLGVSQRQVERYAASGRLDAERIGGTLVLGEIQVREMCEERHRSAAA